eukprot:SM000207S06170  [mRNA]  locus=s207:73707:76106:- [translate_table: standard]
MATPLLAKWRSLSSGLSRTALRLQVVARDGSRLEPVAKEISAIRSDAAACLSVPADITDKEAVVGLAEQVRSRFESVDVLVNNAGICHTGKFEDTDLDTVEKQMAVNFFGQTYMTHAFLPDLLKALGTVVMVNSFGGLLPLKNMSAYSASKHALHGLTEAMRLELAPQGVHVAQVHPGVINSDYLERATFVGKDAEKQREQMKQARCSSLSLSCFDAHLLSSRFTVQPSDVAAAVLRAITHKKKEIIVGMIFKTAVQVYRMSGINVMALGV